jgi:predicted nucleic acid-binding protein
VARRVIQALLDTSAIIASPEAISLAPEDTAAISVITLGELYAGVRLAGDASARAQRQARLAAVRATFVPVAVDEAIAQSYGELLSIARANRRASKATDLLIIATAWATGRTLVTLDDDQASLARLAGVAVRA